MADFILEARNYDSLVARFGDLLEGIVEKTGRDIEATAKQIIIQKDIIDTGATLNTTESRRSIGADRFTREIGPTTDYAPFLEFGTTRTAARPFMRPAEETHRKPFLDAIGQVIQRAAGG